MQRHLYLILHLVGILAIKPFTSQNVISSEQKLVGHPVERRVADPGGVKSDPDPIQEKRPNPDPSVE